MNTQTISLDNLTEVRSMDSTQITSSKKQLWAGWIMGGLPAVFLLLDAIMKFVKPAAVVEGTLKVGFPESTIVGLGIALLLSTLLYLFPRTAVLGAILLTGYLGGAVATNVRVLGPVFNIVFPIVFGVLLWGALWLRDRRLQALLPFRAR
jgi:DoxX-like family